MGIFRTQWPGTAPSTPQSRPRADTAAAIVCTIVASIYSMVFVTVIIGSSSVFTFVVKISDKFKRETFCELLFMVLLVIPSILLILGFALGGVMALCET